MDRAEERRPRLPALTPEGSPEKLLVRERVYDRHTSNVGGRGDKVNSSRSPCLPRGTGRTQGPLECDGNAGRARWETRWHAWALFLSFAALPLPPDSPS